MFIYIGSMTATSSVMGKQNVILTYFMVLIFLYPVKTSENQRFSVDIERDSNIKWAKVRCVNMSEFLLLLAKELK